MNAKSTIKTILWAAMTLTELHKKNRPFCALSFQTAMMLLVMLLMLGAQTARAQQYARQIMTGAYLHGGVTTDKTSAYEGETVTLTVTPDAGYHLALLYLDDRQSILYPSNHIVPVQSSTDPSKYTFTCPATTESSAALNVTATFEEDASLTIRVVPEGGGTYSLDGTKLYVTPNTGYYINNVTWYSGNSDGGGTVTSVVLNDAMGYYEAPNSSGYVVVTLHKWGDYDDVRVSFNMKDHGTAPPAQNLTLGDKVKRPDDPTADGYVFLGWYTNSSCTKLFDFDTVLDNTLKYDTSNDRYTLTLYAKWALGGSCGKSGSDVKWYVSKSAGSTKYDVLTIFGSGEMKDYKDNESPWYDYRNQIKTVVVEEGVTTISEFAFDGFVNVTSDITIPASVTSIGQFAFQRISKNTAAGIHISASEGSALTSIDIFAFDVANASIDLSRCTNLTAINNENVFSEVTHDVTLPSGVTSICQWAFGRFSGEYFLGDHAYVVVPEGKALSVTISGVTEPVVIEPTDGKSDILACLYADPSNRIASRALTLAMVDNETPAPTTYAITTDGNCEVYYYNDDFSTTVATEAEEGKELSIRIKEGAQPATGKYFTGEFKLNGTSLGKNGAVFVDEFTMPAAAVTVSAVQADQMTLTYDFTTAGAQEMPSAAELLFNGDGRVNYAYVEEGGYTAYDFDKSGTPDMKLYFDNDREQYYVQRLAGADAKGTFTFTYTGLTVQYGSITFFFPTVTTAGGTTITTTIGGGYAVAVDDDGNTGGVINLPDGTEVGLTYSRTLGAPSGSGDKTIDGQPAKLYTTCLPYTPTTGTGIKYYTLSGASGSTLLFDEDNSPAKETPYLVAVFSGSFDEGTTNTDVTLRKTVTGSSADGYTMMGTLMGLTNTEAAGKYILQPGGVWQKVASGNEGVYIPPFRAYIEGTASGARLLGSTLDGETVGIDSIRTTDSDGTERWYDLNGRRIEKPNRKGLYIRNGKVTTTDLTD